MKYLVTMEVAAHNYEADEYGQPVCTPRGLKVSMVRVVRAATNLGLSEALAMVRGNPSLDGARGRQVLTLIVGDGGLGRLLLLERETAAVENSVHYAITSIDRIGRYSPIIIEEE